MNRSQIPEKWCFQLETPTKHTSILALPDGGYRQYYNNPHTFFESTMAYNYIAEQSIKWYLHWREIHGFRADPNGTLFLVTDCYHAKTWAMSIYHDRRKLDLQYPLRLHRTDPSQDHYEWINAQELHRATGPPKHQLNSQTMKAKGEVHCFAVGVLKIQCDNEAWKRHTNPGSPSIIASLTRIFGSREETIGDIVMNSSNK